MATQSTTMVVPMTAQTAVSNAVATLKWLARPRTTCPTMAIISIVPAVATTAPARRAHRRAVGEATSEIIHTSVAP